MIIAIAVCAVVLRAMWWWRFVLPQVAPQRHAAGAHADARRETRSGMEHTWPGTPKASPADEEGGRPRGGRPRGGERARFRDAAAALFLQSVRRAAPGPVLRPVRRPGRMTAAFPFLPSPPPFSGSSQVVSQVCPWLFAHTLILGDQRRARRAGTSFLHGQDLL